MNINTCALLDYIGLPLILQSSSLQAVSTLDLLEEIQIPIYCKIPIETVFGEIVLFFKWLRNMSIDCRIMLTKFANVNR